MCYWPPTANENSLELFNISKYLDKRPGFSDIKHLHTESLLPFFIIYNKYPQKQPPRLVLTKMCSEKMLWNFIEITFWHGCSSVNLLHIFRTRFYKNIYGGLLLDPYLKTKNKKHYVLLLFSITWLKTCLLFHSNFSNLTW